MSNTSQTKEVLKHLQSGQTLSSLEAVNLYGATRLSAIIYDLRKAGYNIISVRRNTINRYGNVTQYVDYELIP